MSKLNFNIHFIQECTTVRVILNFGSGFSKKNSDPEPHQKWIRKTTVLQ